MVVMKNVYDKKLKIVFNKMCNKESREGSGDLCISITLPNKTTTHNYHVEKESLIKFINKNYLKEILKEYGITQNEFYLFVGAKRI